MRTNSLGSVLSLSAMAFALAGPSIGACLASCVVDADCDDGNACTDDACSGGVCEHADNSGPCGGDACLVSVCVAGVCTDTETPIACDDGNDCTSDSCDPVTGCVFAPSSATYTCDNYWNGTTCCAPCNGGCLWLTQDNCVALGGTSSQSSAGPALTCEDAGVTCAECGCCTFPPESSQLKFHTCDPDQAVTGCYALGGSFEACSSCLVAAPEPD